MQPVPESRALGTSPILTFQALRNPDGGNNALRQSLTLPEIQAALTLARVTPVPTSPLAGVPPASMVDTTASSALQQKSVANSSGSLSAEWLRALSTLADPLQQDRKSTRLNSSQLG